MGDGEGSKPPLAALSPFWDAPETLTNSSRCELATISHVLAVVLLQFVCHPKQQPHGKAGTASVQGCKDSLLSGL